IKFLFRLHDGHPIEAVLIPDDDSPRKALCISSQAGCALGCKFCATGTLGLLRDLTPGEIVGQMMYLRDRFGGDAFTNVVMMGMGEPLMNFNNVVTALRIASDSLGMGHPARKITISTSGVSPKIKKLADTGLKTRLAISLHAADQAKRERIMPIAQTFKLDKLMEAIRYYTERTGFRVTFEYIVFEDFNDTMDDVKALARLIQGIPCKINLLAYNPVDGLDFERPSDDKVDWFARQLYPRAPAVTVRKSRGQDIDAACGQLAAKHSIRRQ
ncbi:23S rRNA (adenine(2503)-C(2))-methyltransferase RlmN, partial [candidate division GN15 bacterium]|nr:23S rRNA (adenine(2503)-C(2))-methyltransferase RlmN [candidate division GN15 bacterium]